MNNKKSYNPFKMWGSYVGAIFLIVYHYSQFFGIPVAWYGEIITFWEYFKLSLGEQFFTIIFCGCVGFLIGWGIHSLIRRIRK